MSKRFDIRYMTCLCVFFILLIWGCKTDTTSQQGGAVYVHITKDPERLHPICYPLSHARPVTQHVFLALADYDPFTLEYTPVMLEQLPKPEPYNTEGVKFTINIAKDAKWDDGKPVTALDYLFTIKAATHPLTAASAYRSYLSNISKVELDNTEPRTAIVYFDEANALSLETATNFEIYPVHIYDSIGVLANVSLERLRDSAAFAKELIARPGLSDFAENFNGQKFSRDVVTGSGPYKVEKWLPEEVVVLTRKENYWGAKRTHPSLRQGPDQIIYKVINDEITAISQLKAGVIDVVSEPSSDQYLRMKDSVAQGQFTFSEENMMRYYFFANNTQHPILSDIKVRRALAYATNVDRYIELFDKGLGQRTVGFVNPVKKFYNKKITPIPFDVEKSKALLTEAGWRDTDNNGLVDKVINGKKTDFNIEYYASGELGANIGLILKEDAKKAGMGINIIQKDFALTKKENLITGNYGIIVSAVTQDLTIDDPYLRFHSSNATLGGTNVAQYVNPKADAIMDQIRENKEDKVLQPLFMQLQEILHEDLPFIYLYVPKNRLISSNKWDVRTSVKRPGYFANTFTYQPAMVK